MTAPFGCDSSHLAAPGNVLAPICSILVTALSNMLVGLFTSVVLIVLAAVYSFWWRFVHFGGNTNLVVDSSILVVY